MNPGLWCDTKETISMALFKSQRLLPALYELLPADVRNFVGPVLEPSYFTVKRVLSIVSQLHLPVYQFQGKSIWGEGTLTTLLFGEGRGMLPYILNLLYADKPMKKGLGKIFIGNVKSDINSYGPNADLVLIGMDEFFSRFLSQRGFVVLPEWIMFKMDLTKPFPRGGKNKGLSNNLRKVRKYQYSFEMTRDFAKFENFFHHMYLPYAANKYGELSLVGGFRDLKKIFEKGVLLLVSRGNDCIAGSLLQMNDKTISARYLGVKDGNFKYVEKGVLAACYYFTITWAGEKRYKWVDFGHCRPFLNDGAFYHKKTWGMEVMKSVRPMLATKAVFGMKVCSHQQGLLDFLAKNPFISLDHGKLKGLIFHQQDHPLTLEEIQALNKTYYIPGIDSFVISSLHGFTQEAQEFATSQTPQRLYLTRLNQDTFLEVI